MVLLGGCAAGALALLLPARWRLRASLAAGCLLRLWVACRSPLILQEWPLNDDSHYYYTIAWNLAHGGGLRHDSVHVTTGFQPLFLLLITPVFAIARDKTAAITMALLVQAAVGVGAALCLRGLAARIGGSVAGDLAIGAWAVAPLFLTHDLSGLETNLALGLVSAAGWLWLRLRADGAIPDRRSAAAVGALCGLAFLARIDTVFLSPILAAGLLAGAATAVPFRERLLRAGILCGAALTLAAPWLAWNLAAIGSILPSSGQAVRFLSQAYGFHFLGGNGAGTRDYFEIGHPPALYYWETLRKAARDIWGVADAAFPVMPGLLLVACAVGARGNDFLRRLRPLGFLAALVLVQLTLYCGWIFGQWFFDRYLTPWGLLWIATVAAAVAALAGSAAPPRRAARAGVALIAAACIGLLAVRSLRRIDSLNDGRTSAYYEAAVWVNTHIPDGATIGAFQTGIFGYYLERRFYGLDGKINVDALHAMQEKRIDEYVDGEGIDYVMDWPWLLRDLFVRRSRDPGFLERGELVWEGRYRAYRIRPDAHPILSSSTAVSTR